MIYHYENNHKKIDFFLKLGELLAEYNVEIKSAPNSYIYIFIDGKLREVYESIAGRKVKHDK